MSYPFLSNLRPGARIHTIAWFRGEFSTLPSCIDIGLSPSQINDAVADDSGPTICEDKAKILYFLATDLRVDLYSGKTATRFPPGARGQMRSAAHVIAGSWFAIDLDELTAAIWAAILKKLQAAGLRFCAYSTWSYGLPAKPGIRVRVLLYMDRALAPADWHRAWHVLNQHFFAGLADPKTRYLYQQAGIWATSADRAHLAFRHVGGSHLLSADSLLAAAPSPPPQALVPSRGWAGLTTIGKDNPNVLAQVAQTLYWLDANAYDQWTRTLAGLKALVARSDLSPDTARTLWLRWSASASAAAQTHNDDPRYAPEALWDRWTPTTAPPEALAATLFALARDHAQAVFTAELSQGQLSPHGLQAGRYLATFHRRLYQKLRQTAPHGG
jgi:hypothetical protein